MKKKLIYSSLMLAALLGGGACSCTGEFDPSGLQNQIDDLDRRVSALEEKVASLQTYITGVSNIVQSLRQSLYVISMQETASGYHMVFSDGSSVTLPKDAGLGIGIAEMDGTFWWTLNGALLLDSNGEKVAVSETAPVIGIIDIDGAWYWTLEGKPIQDGNGRPVEAEVSRPVGGSSSGDIPDTPLTSVSVSNGLVIITLADGTRLSLPMAQAANMRIEANKLHFAYGQVLSTHVAMEGIAGATITEKPEGWRAELKGCALTITAPAPETDAEQEGYVVVLATSGTMTMIGKVFVTTEAPLFSMSVKPDGTMTLKELDPDFSNPGFWAGFAEADSFDPAAIVAPAKDYTPQSGEGFYSSELNHNIKDYIKNPVPGKRYAAYCFPGCYSKWIGVDPDPDDVFVKYFTYVENRFEVLEQTVDAAEISVSINGAGEFYGGLILNQNYTEEYLSSMFLDDAMAPIQGYGDGMYGGMMKSYKGSLSLFAAPKDGDGKTSERTVIPGAEYIIALIPADSQRVYSEYSEDDVILCRVKLDEPVQASETLVTVSEGESSTISASACFNISESTSKFFYKVVRESEFLSSGMSEYSYALYYGIKWDRAIIGAKTAVECVDEIIGLAPGEKCRAIGLAFNEQGHYQLVSMEVSSTEVVLSSGTLSITGHSSRAINANSTEFTFSLSFSNNIVCVRYIDRLTKAEFEQQWNGEAEAYSLLTAGRSWDYESINPKTEELQMYLYPEDTDYILFAVGVDKEGKYTELAKYEFNALD